MWKSTHGKCYLREKSQGETYQSSTESYIRKDCFLPKCCYPQNLWRGMCELNNLSPIGYFKGVATCSFLLHIRNSWILVIKAELSTKRCTACTYLSGYLIKYICLWFTNYTLFWCFLSWFWIRKRRLGPGNVRDCFCYFLLVVRSSLLSDMIGFIYIKVIICCPEIGISSC